MVFFQLNVTGLLFQSFRTASPLWSDSLSTDYHRFQSFNISIFFSDVVVADASCEFIYTVK